ncbi:MAG: ChbG/HpnK family deacetylase [Ilumatobacter sp.]|nr:ChbG/HpnK family deacetylase [Ilumatobacter sp.]
MRQVVIHADDVGMCHGANRAFVELSHAGTIGAGSVMVPCPWFPEIAAIAADDPDLDVGVHLTLNAEQAGYRWAPLTRPGSASGLTDDSGYCWATVAEVRAHAHPDAVEAEWRAQIDRALGAGIDVTHLDTHMGSALAPEWCERYVQVGIDYGVPALVTGRIADYGPNNHLEGVDPNALDGAVAMARDAGMPVFDRVLETDFGRRRGDDHDYPAMFATAHDDDLVYCAFHPCCPGEIEMIEPDAHHVRVDEYELFGHPSWRGWLDEQQFEIVGMRPFRDAMRSGSGPVE